MTTYNQYITSLSGIGTWNSSLSLTHCYWYQPPNNRTQAVRWSVSGSQTKLWECRQHSLAFPLAVWLGKFILTTIPPQRMQETVPSVMISADTQPLLTCLCLCPNCNSYPQSGGVVIPKITPRYRLLCNIMSCWSKWANQRQSWGSEMGTRLVTCKFQENGEKLFPQNCTWGLCHWWLHCLYMYMYPPINCLVLQCVHLIFCFPFFLLMPIILDCEKTQPVSWYYWLCQCEQ